MSRKQKIKRIILIVLVTAAVCYGLACLGLWLFQDSFIFYPQPLEPAAPGAAGYKDRTVTFDRDGVELHGWLVNPGRPKLLIFYGGNAEEVSHHLPEFERFKDFTALAVNYRGFGESQGEPSQEALFSDALAVYDEMVAKLKPESIVLLGRSLGSGVACHVASQRPVSKLILVTPFDSILSIAQSRYPIFPVKAFLNHPFPSMDYAPKIGCPCLMVLSETDDIVPHEHSLTLSKALAGKVTLATIKGSRHENIHAYPKLWEAVAAFMQP